MGGVAGQPAAAVEQARFLLGRIKVADPGDIHTQMALSRLEAAQLWELIEERKDGDVEHFQRIHEAIRVDREEIAKLKAVAAEHAAFIAALQTARTIFWGVVAILVAAAGIFFGFKKSSVK